MIDAESVDPMPEEDDGDRFDSEPVPLTQAVVLPPFPVEALPTPFANMVRALSEATQTDPAMAATSALSALSACVGGRVEVEIRSGWREPLNLYTATIAAPGERKSAVQQAMIRPILDVEAQLVATGSAARVEAGTRKQIAVKAAESQSNSAARAKDKPDQAIAEAIRMALIAAALEVPPIPRLVADDITPEAAASLLAEQGGRLAVISAEGGIFDIIAGRYSRSIPNMDLWLKGHSGDALKVDRKGRPPEYVRHPALTLGLMIQPAVLSAIAANREFRGRGFLARILYAFPVSKIGRRQIAPQPVDAEVERSYEDAVGEFALGLAKRTGDPAILTLTQAAGEVVQSIEKVVEPTLAGDGELAPLADWGAKYVGAIARIAGILHLAEHGNGEGFQHPVSPETITAAARIGHYFRSAAIKAFAEMGIDQSTADALYLLERVGHLGQDEVSHRDMHRAAKKFKSRHDFDFAVDRLVDHGYLIPLAVPKSKGGRPGSPRYTVTKVPEESKGHGSRSSVPFDPFVTSSAIEKSASMTTSTGTDANCLP